jgi:hypothetical protein
MSKIKTRVSRFTILTEDGKSYVYSNTDALLKSGSYDECMTYITKVL